MFISYFFVSDNTAMDKLGARDVAVASSVSKIFASTLTYPHEVCCWKNGLISWVNIYVITDQHEK